MADGNPTWFDADGEPRRSSRRGTLIVGAAAGAAVLSVIGAVAGWVLADPGPDGPAEGRGQGYPTMSASSPSAPPPRVTAVPVTTGAGRPSTAATRRPAGQFPLPDVVGLDFEPARRQLRALGLGVHLVFADSGEDRGVVRTDPAAGTGVRRGLTVKVYVAGAAPAATVPSVTGLTCAEAGRLVVEHGLFPDYPAGRTGRVMRQDPEPPADVRWNDRVRLYCGSTPAGSPTP